MIIDGHQHFWQLSRGDYGWLNPELGAIYRDFLPADMLPMLQRCSVDGTILVQAAPTIAETSYLLSLAAETGFIKGVVGWVDFEAADVAGKIHTLAQDPLLVGLRPMIQDIGDPDWMLRSEISSAFTAIIDSDLTFDALLFPHHLPRLQQLLERHPDLRTVIDHAAKPEIRNGAYADWAADMAMVSKNRNTFCKVSGLLTEAATGATANDIRPYTDHLLETFGPDRLIWGSDWPVCLMASGYRRWFDMSQELFRSCSDDERKAIFGLNAIRAYRLGEESDA